VLANAIGLGAIPPNKNEWSFFGLNSEGVKDKCDIKMVCDSPLSMLLVRLLISDYS
jgi:hypothetical protein